jgi:3-deoxy-manno-octulosonate cytidylyltransferase (CMP-KDO synthetase)
VDAAVVIPARYASSRLPGKPILEQARRVTGKYIIQHVYEHAAEAEGVSRVVVATDDERIAAAVREFGGEARMTREDHTCGTDRIAEVAADLQEPLVVNVQGDEPEIRPEQVTQVVRMLRESDDAAMSTLAHPVDSEREWRDPNAVKVVVDKEGYALYFSRSPLPFVRDSEDWMDDTPLQPLRHLGIYGYRRDFLLRYSCMEACPLEEAEKLEQLRALWHGYRIRVGETSFRCTGIDTPADLERWLEKYEAR